MAGASLCAAEEVAQAGVLGLQLEQVGAEIGVTRERVRQIETRALRELEAKNPGLRDFLRGAE